MATLLKMIPSCKEYLWGGRRLMDEYYKECTGEILAETWELSCHPDGPCVIENGPFAGYTLAAYIAKRGREVLGSNCRRFQDFPVLIKFIDAKENLSIQVHPDNQYALWQEKQYGKTEMWYIVDCEEDSYLYYGFNKEVDLSEFTKRIAENTLPEILNRVEVQKGDVFFIEAGTIHAICANIVVAEIQQNSNVTYRVYDYGRVGADGRKRDLHIEQALAVTKRKPAARRRDGYPHIADCDYFTVDRLLLDGAIMEKVCGHIDETSFASILIVDGEGQICCGDETLPYRRGDSFFLDAGSGRYEIAGSCEALVTTVRA